MRTLSIAAFAVLSMTPEAVLNPGFQMSFAATLALVSIYQRLAPALLTAPPAKDGGAVYRVGVTAGRWLLAGALTSLLAGLATTPYAVFHFQRGSDGRLTVLAARQNRISADSWLAADGDTRKSRDPLEGGFRCDAAGCAAKLADGTTIAVARRPEAFADDCREAALVVSPLDVPAACAAAAVDRRALASTGALALRRVKGEWVAEPVRSPFADRPWYGRARAPDPAALARLYRRPNAPAGTEPLARPDEIPVPDEGSVNEEE